VTLLQRGKGEDEKMREREREIKDGMKEGWWD